MNGGLLWEPSEALRIGLAYCGGIERDLEGSFTVDPFDQERADPYLGSRRIENHSIAGSLDLPASYSLSGWWQATPRVVLLADLTRVGWSSIREIRFEPTDATPVDHTFAERWQWSAAFGAIHAHHPDVARQVNASSPTEEILRGNLSGSFDLSQRVWSLEIRRSFGESR